MQLYRSSMNYENYTINNKQYTQFKINFKDNQSKKK